MSYLNVDFLFIPYSAALWFNIPYKFLSNKKFFD